MRFFLACLATIALLSPSVAIAQPDSAEVMPAPPTEDPNAPKPESVKMAFLRLEEQIRSELPELRRQVAQELGQLGDLRAGALLVHLLEKDPVGEVRSSAALGLGVLKSREARDALETASARDPDQQVRRSARVALAILGVSSPVRANGEPPPVPAGDRTSMPHEAEASTAPRSPTAPAYTRKSEYISAYRRRTAGIMVTVIGGGLGLIAGILGGLSGGVCLAIAEESFESNTDCSVPAGIAITGGVTLAAGLAVGLPLLFSGQKRMKAIATSPVASMPYIGVSVTQKKGLFSAAWHF